MLCSLTSGCLLATKESLYNRREFCLLQGVEGDAHGFACKVGFDDARRGDVGAEGGRDAVEVAVVGRLIELIGEQGDELLLFVHKLGCLS